MTGARHDGRQSSLASMGPTAVKAAAWCALAFWLYYAFLRQVAGPLNPDEIYFSHTLWLVNQGKRQYVDFYSNHLPAYFQLLKPLAHALSGQAADLSFVWGVRSISAAIILAYVTLGWALLRHALPGAARERLLAGSALLLVFVVLARMVEVRADTFGLLLVNAGWAAVLWRRTVSTMVAAALLAGLALLFSARAGEMAAVMGLLLLVLAARSRDAAAVRALLAVAALFVVAGLCAYLAAPEWVALVVRSCFLEPARMVSGPSIAARFVAPDRIPLTIMIVGGVLSGAWLMRHERSERGVVVAVACAAQLLMVVADPAPFQYVYGWAAVPAVVGLASASPLFTLSLPFGMAAALLGASIGYTVDHGHVPPTSTYVRLTLDAPLGTREVAALPTPDLVQLLISDAGQESLANQLRVRSEVCRRLGGKVLTTFDTHPICLDDAMFYWTGLRWPAVFAGDAAAPDAMSHDAFARAFGDAHARLFIWAHRWEPPRPLLPWARQVLACCYDIRNGVAIANEAARPRAGIP